MQYIKGTKLTLPEARQMAIVTALEKGMPFEILEKTLRGLDSLATPAPFQQKLEDTAREVQPTEAKHCAGDCSGATCLAPKVEPRWYDGDLEEIAGIIHHRLELRIAEVMTKWDKALDYDMQQAEQMGRDTKEMQRFKRVFMNLTNECKSAFTETAQSLAEPGFVVKVMENI